MKNTTQEEGFSLLGTRARAYETMVCSSEPVEVEVSAIDMRPWQSKEMSGNRVQFQGRESRKFDAEIIVGDEFTKNQLTLNDNTTGETYVYELDDNVRCVSLGEKTIDVPIAYDPDFYWGQSELNN